MPMPKCDFNKVALQIEITVPQEYKFAAYFWNIFY